MVAFSQDSNDLAQTNHLFFLGNEYRYLTICLLSVNAEIAFLISETERVASTRKIYVASRTLRAFNILNPCRLNIGAFIMKRTQNCTFAILMRYINIDAIHLLLYYLLNLTFSPLIFLLLQTEAQGEWFKLKVKVKFERKSIVNSISMDLPKQSCCVAVVGKFYFIKPFSIQ